MVYPRQLQNYQQLAKQASYACVAAMALALVSMSGCRLLLNFGDVPETGPQCGDKLDNDLNGQIDCGDLSCANSAFCARRGGDLAISNGEECDDGNGQNGDGGMNVNERVSSAGLNCSTVI